MSTVKATKIQPYAKTKSGPKKKRSTVLTIVMWTCSAYFLIPLIWLFLSSTKNNSDLFGTFGLGFGNSFELFNNIHSLTTFQNGVFWRWMLNTLIYALVSSLGAALLATGAGYSLAKYTFRGKKVVVALIMGSIMVPVTALALPTYLVFSAINLADTPLAIILPSLISPFGVFLMMVYAQDAVDDSLLEAARIDGAGELRAFFTVGSRLLAPGFATVLLFQLVATWNNYFLPLIMLNSSKYYPITVGLAQWQASAASGAGGQVLFSTVLTGAFVSIIPLIIAFIFLQRFWVSGLSTGSVKG